MPNLQVLHNSIANFSNGGGANHLSDINSALDAIIGAFHLPTYSLNKDDMKALIDSREQLQQKAVEEVEKVREAGRTTAAEHASLKEALSETTRRSAECDAEIARQKARLDGLLSQQQQQFSQAQEERNKSFADAMAKYSTVLLEQKGSFDEAFTDANLERVAQFTKHIDALQTLSDKHREWIEARKKEVDEIFGAIGSTAFAGHFKATADMEGKAANLWRWIALALMAAMIVVAGYAFYYSIGHETDWRVFIFRLGTVLVVAVPAVYAANESSKHRERERMNRKFHLELASIDAYLVLLPEEERNKIKGGLAERFFGVPLLKEKGNDVTGKDLFGLLSAVLENLTKGK